MREGPANSPAGICCVIILSFFGVIVGVNLTMATLASTSWTGLVVENTYVASQQFNRMAEEGRAQAALGWTGKLTIARGEVRYSLSDAAGKPVPLHGVKVLFRHPAYEGEDKAVTARRSPRARNLLLSTRQGTASGSSKSTPMPVCAEPYRDVRRIMISHGALQ